MHPHARTEDLELQWVDDHLIIYDLSNDRAHSLDPLAARVWELSDGMRSAGDIVAALGDESLDVEDVWTALDVLGDAELLQQRAGPPAGERRVSRRTLIRDVAAAGALGLGVPGAVKSILAPEPLAAQSGGGGESSTKEADLKASEQQAKEQSRKQQKQAEQNVKQQAEQDLKQQQEQQAKEEDLKAQQTEQNAKQAEQAQKEAARK